MTDIIEIIEHSWRLTRMKLGTQSGGMSDVFTLYWWEVSCQICSTFIKSAYVTSDHVSCFSLSVFQTLQFAFLCVFDLIVEWHQSILIFYSLSVWSYCQMKPVYINILFFVCLINSQVRSYCRMTPAYINILFLSGYSYRTMWVVCNDSDQIDRVLHYISLFHWINSKNLSVY